MSSSHPMLNQRSSRRDEGATRPAPSAKIRTSRRTASSTDGAPLHLTAGVGQTLLKVIDASSRTTAKMVARNRRRSATMTPQPEHVDAEGPGQERERARGNKGARR